MTMEDLRQASIFIDWFDNVVLKNDEASAMLKSDHDFILGWTAVRDFSKMGMGEFLMKQVGGTK